MQWTLCLYPQLRHDPSDPAPAATFEKRLREISASFDEASSQGTDLSLVKHVERRMERLLQSISGQFSMVGQPSSRQLTRFWFLRGEIYLALGEHQAALDTLECCAGLVAQNPARDRIAVDFLRARVTGNMRLFRRSMEGYAAVIEHSDQLQPGDFADGDLPSFRCYAYLQRAKHYLALGYFDQAQTDMVVATDILDEALPLIGAPRHRDAEHGDNQHMHSIFAGYDERLRALAARGEAALAGTTMQNWLQLCIDIPANYAAVEMWHTRLCMQERCDNGLLLDFYTLIVACGNLSPLLPTWAATTTLLYCHAAEVAIVGYDITYLRYKHSETDAHVAEQRSWLQRADQALVNVFSESEQDDDMAHQEVVLNIALVRHSLWLRQQHMHIGDLPYMPDLIEIGTGVRQLLQLAIAQGQLWSAACCNHLLGYIALVLGDQSSADCCLHDALTLFEQAHGDIFYPRYEELRRAIASLNL